MPPYGMHRANFTTQSLQNFSAARKSAHKWFVRSQISTFKFVFKTRILMTYNFAEVKLSFSMPNTLQLPLNYKNVYIKWPNIGSLSINSTRHGRALRSKPASANDPVIAVAVKTV
jgi:hypothetical protein